MSDEEKLAAQQQFDRVIAELEFGGMLPSERAMRGVYSAEEWLSQKQKNGLIEHEGILS
jgi:hypothetical protein